MLRLSGARLAMGGGGADRARRARGVTRELLLLLAAFGAASCGAGDDGPDNESASRKRASGASCPAGGSTLTYDNFARGFADQHCTRCHSSTKVGSSARSGAPEGYDFDSLAGFRAVDPLLLDQMAAAGPKSANTAMPLRGSQPTLEQREQFGQWLACGLP